MDERKKNGMVEEVVEDLMEDPDAPEKRNAARPPQTIDAEPEDGSR